jgi:hypothetical protein
MDATRQQQLLAVAINTMNRRLLAANDTRKLPAQLE